VREEDDPHRKLHICEAFAELRVLVADYSNTGHPSLRFGSNVSTRTSDALLITQVGIVNAARTALRGDDALKEFAQIFLAAREIETPDEDRAFRIAYATTSGGIRVRAQGAAHVLRVVEGGDRAFCGVVGS